MKITANLLVSFITFLFFNSTQAQEIIKLNVTSLVVGNLNVDGEWGIGKKTSFNLGLNLVSGANLIALDINRVILSDKEYFLNGKLKGVGLVPEIRFYLGKRGKLNSFYIAPYGNMAYYQLPDISYERISYIVSTIDPNFPILIPSNSIVSYTNQRVGMIGVGGMIGVQSILGENERFVIDWGIGGLGINFLGISMTETVNGLSMDKGIMPTIVPSIRGNIQLGIVL